MPLPLVLQISQRDLFSWFTSLPEFPKSMWQPTYPFHIPCSHSGEHWGLATSLYKASRRYSHWHLCEWCPPDHIEVNGVFVPGQHNSWKKKKRKNHPLPPLPFGKVLLTQHRSLLKMWLIESNYFTGWGTLLDYVGVGVGRGSIFIAKHTETIRIFSLKNITEKTPAFFLSLRLKMLKWQVFLLPLQIVLGERREGWIETIETI